MAESLKLSNGKEIYANCGIIGLAPKDEDVRSHWMPSEGYDSGFPNASFAPYFDKSDYEYDHITKDEMLEVCDIMIKRWKEYKNYVEQQKDA